MSRRHPFLEIIWRLIRENQGQVSDITLGVHDNHRYILIKDLFQ
jgi:hypothetical protein